MIKNKKSFTIGSLLLLSFILCFIVIMLPIYGDGRNGLNYSDDMFNSFSKSSSNFITETAGVAEAQKGVTISLNIVASSPAEAIRWGKLYTDAGAVVDVKDSSLSINGDFGKILNAVVIDSASMYNNDGKAVEQRYGYGAREATFDWYNSLKKIDKELNSKSMFKESAALTKVLQKALEPGYNFYGVEKKQVSENIGILSFLLIFYLLYTVWYGFGLFYFFEGFGITTSKSHK